MILVKKTWVDSIRNNHAVIVIAESEAKARINFDIFLRNVQDKPVAHSSTVILREMDALEGVYKIN